MAWKHFLPAKWAREMGQVFNSRTGIIKQPGRTYRSQVNVPDDMERSMLKYFVDAGHGESKPRTAFAAWANRTCIATWSLFA